MVTIVWITAIDAAVGCYGLLLQLVYVGDPFDMSPLLHHKAKELMGSGESETLPPIYLDGPFCAVGDFKYLQL